MHGTDYHLPSHPDLHLLFEGPSVQKNKSRRLIILVMDKNAFMSMMTARAP